MSRSGRSSLLFCRQLPQSTIGYSARRSLIRWDCIPRHAMESGILSSSFMPTFILPCCGPRRLVGFELLGGPQRDITPESAAEVLRQANARLSASRSA
jgi:hypothetical protein